MTSTRPTHYTEEELTLHFYGDTKRGPRIARHLEACPRCQALYDDIAATLSLIVPPPAPERGELYGLEVWQRIRPMLPERPAGHHASRVWGFAFVTMTVAVSFAAGSFVALHRPANDSPSPPTTAVRDGGATDRARMAAIADHLERSERLLLDVVNHDGAKLDVRSRQLGAAELIDSNRVYRHASRRAGDLIVADVLDDLERHLLDIVHGPPTLGPSDLEGIRARFESDALMFKVRVLADGLDHRGYSTLYARTTP
jgi:hypothetical protein